jgi:PAS domain S-box-containing protein
LLASLQAKIEQLLAAQKSLQSNEAQFRTIFDSSPTGMMLLDMDGRIVQSNAQLGRILGYTAWELIGRFLSDLISPQAIPVFERHMRDFLQGAPGKRQITSRFQRRDGQIVWGELDLGVVRNEAGEPLEVVGMLADITDRKEMESEIQEMNRKLLDSLESERLRLAQELHDGPIQELHSISYQIEALRQNAASADPQTLAELKNAVMKTIRSLRETAKELRPPSLMDFGLEKAIRSHVEDIHEKYPQLKITLELSPDRDQLPEETRVSLFRIYQQAMMNVVLHARASEVRVRFTYDAEEIVLSIEDNGCGFIVPRHWIDLIRQGHFGLAGAAERVQALGGVFEVRTDPGKGTRLSAFIPRQPFEEKAG